MKKISKITEYIKSHYKIILAVLFAIGAFYWFQVRPAHIKSTCSEVSYLRAKAEALMIDSNTDLYRAYLSTANPPTYRGLNDFLENRYKNYADLRLQGYDQKNFNSEYSRCLHEYGL